MATGAMVTGIVSLLLAVVGVFVLPLFLAVPGGIAAIVLGAAGRKRAKNGAPGGGQATTGIVTGIVSLLVSAIWVALVVVLGAQFLAEFSDELAELEACIEETGDPDLCRDRFTEEIFEQLDR